MCTKLVNQNKESSSFSIDSKIFQDFINQIKTLTEARQEEKASRESELFTVESLADYLKIAPQTIYKYVTAREIPHVKLGKFIRFRKSDIDAWIAEHAVHAIKKERR